MSKPISIAIWMMVSLAVFPSATLHAQPVESFVTVSGSAAYRQRIAMPPDAVLTVRVEDVSRADAPAPVLAETSEPFGARQVPIAFSLTVPTAAIDPRFSYALRATIIVDGKLRFTTARSYAVLTSGAPNHVDLLLDAVQPAPAETPVAAPGSATSPRPAVGFALPATFAGVMPCADCAGVTQTLTLRADGLYRLRRMPELIKNIHPAGQGHFGVAERGIMALVNPERLRRILTKMLDEDEFLSPYGIRSLSKFHEQHPYILHVGGQEHRVDYLPAESNTGMFGGNSNWRGPVWMPVNGMIIRALHNFYLYYGDNFKIECPTGSGKMMNLFEVAKDIADRLSRIFLRDPSTGSGQAGRRPVYGGTEKFQSDPHWRDHVLFYEYFHGDNGAGLGASHQTGWTGLVARLIQMYGLMDAKQALEGGKRSVFKQRNERNV